MLRNKFFCLFLLFGIQLIAYASIEIPQELKISFEQGMSPSIHLGVYKPSNAFEDKNWHLASTLFQNYITKFNYTTQARIPKIIHQIYVGNPIPEKCKALQKTWQKLHPDWEYRLWTDKEIDEFDLQNRALYDSTQNFAQRADIARYEILYRIGGLYVDMDFECVKPFDILHHSLDFYAGIEYNKNFRVNNALIGAKPGHPILKACIDSLQQPPPPLESGLSERDQEVEPVVQKTGPGFFTRAIVSCSNLDNTALFPNTFFYPFNWKEQVTLYPETFAMHHWHASWVTKTITHRDSAIIIKSKPQAQ